MNQRHVLYIVVGAMVASVPLVWWLRGSRTDELPATQVAVAEDLARLDPRELLARAEALLATDRPWQGARVMRAYVAQERTPTSDAIVLAARAEAGWGGWPEVRALLEGVPNLEAYADGLALYLLARARDVTGDAPGAVDSYRAFLALSPPAGEREPERMAARLLLGLALIRAGDRAGATRELSVARERAGGASIWLDLLEADALAATGDTAAVRVAVAAHQAGIPGLRAWRARIEAARRAGDIAAARAIANQARTWARTDATRAEFYVAAGLAAIEMGDVSPGRGALRAAIDLNAATPHARQAAAHLVQGPMTPADHLAVARVYRAQGLHQESLDGYRHWLEAGAGTAAERGAVHLEHANALFYAERYDDVRGALRPIASQTDARFLLARAEAHRDDVEEAVRIYLGLATQFAGTGTGAQALYLAANTRQDANDFRRARELYQRVVAGYGARPQVGLSMMRLAGMAYHERNFAEAARIWDQYRTRFPRGTHALESTYWAGRAREAAGDATGAATLYRAVRQRDRESYYALRASERLGEPFWPLPMGQVPGASAEAGRRVATWMQGIDLLRTAGFEEEASAEADRVVAGMGTDRPTRYALAEALIERGYSQRAVRIGIGLQATEPLNRRLLRILYPFPYRTLISEEARDRGVDPFVAAALIRQESVFERRITSPAGARGLMQIMPATGRGLAESVGIERWDGELLYHPEINVHLGTSYLARHMQNYDGSLPAVFSAYNAGSHRVARWQVFAEHGDEELFTERIPFRETRDYVKILTRNHALYRGLHGDG